MIYIILFCHVQTTYIGTLFANIYYIGVYKNQNHEKIRKITNLRESQTTA